MCRKWVVFFALLLCGFSVCADSPFQRVGAHPTASRSVHSMIHVLHPWRGKIYMGFGHWDDRPGPVPLVSYEPAMNRFVVEHSLGSDSIALFRAFKDQLYALSIDPAHFKETVDYAVSDGVTWRDETQLGFMHLFDMTTLNGDDLWVSGSKAAVEGAPGKAALWRSLDGGKSWEDATPPHALSRYYWTFSFLGKLYVNGQCFDGAAWKPSPLMHSHFSKSTRVFGQHGERMIGRSRRAPGSIAFEGGAVEIYGYSCGSL